MLSFISQRMKNDKMDIKYRKSTGMLQVENCKILYESKQSIIYKVFQGKYSGFAIKNYISKPFINSKIRLEAEIDIYNKIKKCKVFIRFHKAVITKAECLLSMEFMPLGNITQHVLPEYALSLNQIRLIAIQLIKALRFLESEKILLRNLSLNNILKRHFSVSSFSVKISNFSCAIDLKKSPPPTDRAGELIYQSPETIVGLEQSCSSDIWSLGIIIFLLCTLRHPFIMDFNISTEEKEEKIFKARFSDNCGYHDITDPSIINLIMKCLVKSPIFRAKASSLIA